MKLNLLSISVAFVGLAGLAAAQNYERRDPGDRPALTPNMVTAGELTQWMQGSIGSTRATADQWCYAMGQLVRGGYTCPPPDKFGFAGRDRNERVDAQTFLNDLRALQGSPNPRPYEERNNSAPYVAEGGPRQQASPGVAACRQAVQDRLRGEGYSDVHVPSINSEDRPGGADRVYGMAEAQGRYGHAEHFDFSCAVNLERGEVHRLEVNPR
jgi:hypothetical protein